MAVTQSSRQDKGSLSIGIRWQVGFLGAAILSYATYYYTAICTLGRHAGPARAGLIESRDQNSEAGRNAPKSKDESVIGTKVRARHD